MKAIPLLYVSLSFHQNFDRFQIAHASSVYQRRSPQLIHWINRRAVFEEAGNTLTLISVQCNSCCAH